MKLCIKDEEQRNWDDAMSGLRAQLVVQPFYLVYDWDPRSTLEATLAMGNRNIRNVDTIAGGIEFSGSTRTLGSARDQAPPRGVAKARGQP